MGRASTPPNVVGVESCQFGGTESVDASRCQGSASTVGTVRVQLRTPLHDVGADPDGLAGGKVRGAVVECHGSGVRLLWNSTGSGGRGQYPNHSRNSPASTPPKAAVVP